MANSRTLNAKLNILISLISQIVTLVCGLIVPGLMIRSYGSEAYGATTSIAQFLAYMSLLEGGVGSVARAALYKPLARMDLTAISQVMIEVKKFFRIVAWIFVAYVLVLACGYKFISNIQCFDWISSFLLVVVISISTFAQYFIGISYSILIQAAQKTYITQAIQATSIIANTIIILVMINMGFNLIMVKFVSSIVFAVRPLLMWLYVKYNYNLSNNVKRDKALLQQKWNGLSQHIAFFLHSNTDVAILTLFTNLSTVAVYSVYHMVIINIQNIVVSFAAGMEAMFGDMIAKNEIEELNRSFEKYESMISAVTVSMFGTTMVMMIPFVRLYTADVHDANYIVPALSIFLVLAAVIFCLRLPYHSVIIAAGKFKETQNAAYAEAILNIGLSALLVMRFGLVGVGFGTMIAVLVRFAFYVFYLNRHIMHRPLWCIAKRSVVNFAQLFFIYMIGLKILELMEIQHFLNWVIAAVPIMLIALTVAVTSTFVFYRADVNYILQRFKRR